jgi:hypothetical protein
MRSNLDRQFRTVFKILQQRLPNQMGSNPKIPQLVYSWGPGLLEGCFQLLKLTAQETLLGRVRVTGSKPIFPQSRSLREGPLGLALGLALGQY